MAGRGQKFAKQAATLAAQTTARRKAQEGLREPNGRLSRSAQKVLDVEANQIVRLRAAALSGVADPRWGSQLGRLYLERKVSPEQYGAGVAWANLMERWRAIHCGPRFNPKAGLANLQRVDGGAGSDSSEDADERERLIMAMVDDAVASFDRGIADPNLIAVRECIELDLAPVGYGGALLLDAGLSHLVELWKVDAR